MSKINKTKKIWELKANAQKVNNEYIEQKVLKLPKSPLRLDQIIFSLKENTVFFFHYQYNIFTAKDRK